MRYWLTLLTVTIGMLAHAQQDTIHVYFDIKSAELNSAALQTIDSNIYYDILIKGTKVGIIGYADYPGSSKANTELSQARAQVVVKYLLNMGMTETDIEAVEGIIPGDKRSKISEAENRRVDIILGGFPNPFANTIPLPDNSQKPNKTLSSMAVNETMRLDQIAFEPGNARLLESDTLPLDQLAQTLKDNPDMVIQIEGHVCCINLYELPEHPTQKEIAFKQVVAEEAMMLSQKRAQKVCDYLISKGISKQRLKVKGFGHTVPVYESDGKTINKQRNRRVEIRVLEK